MLIKTNAGIGNFKKLMLIFELSYARNVGVSHRPHLKTIFSYHLNNLNNLRQVIDNDRLAIGRCPCYKVNFAYNYNTSLVKSI